MNAMGDVIFVSDDLGYDATMMFFTSMIFDSGFADGIEDDPMLMHMDLTAGTYFVEVSVDTSGAVEHSADPADTLLFYDLFITSEGMFVPEPTVLAYLPLGILLLLKRRSH